MFLIKCCVLLAWCLSFGASLPTIYKYNENKMLQPDLIPVSSTVIPIPVYKVSYGLHVAPSLKDDKVKKPEGPITLITAYNKKKATSENQQQSKVKLNSDYPPSSIKEIPMKY